MEIRGNIFLRGLPDRGNLDSPSKNLSGPSPVFSRDYAHKKTCLFSLPRAIFAVASTVTGQGQTKEAAPGKIRDRHS
jgi:hypothetical protein